jgi:6-pyruvoyltetrahydropterin/6-carboxytetrahydropterin synthase
VITVTKVFKADAAHVLPDHDGKCARLHGHTYTYEVTIGQGLWYDDSLPTTGPTHGMVVDFGDLTRYWKEYVEPLLDHVSLNESLGIYPTAENICMWVSDWLQEFCTLHGVHLVSVRVHEGPDSFATFTPNYQGGPKL